MPQPNNLGLLPTQPSQTMPRFDETQPMQTPTQPAGQPADFQVTDEMKGQYQQWVANGMKLIHAPETRDTIVSHLKGVQPPERALGDATLMVVKRLESEEANSGPVDDIIKLDGANEIMGQLYEIAETAGIFQLDETGKSRAYGYAIQQYIKEGIASGKLDPEEVKKGVALLQQRQEPEQASVTGELMAKAPDDFSSPQAQQPAPAQPQGLIGGVA